MGIRRALASLLRLSLIETFLRTLTQQRHIPYSVRYAIYRYVCRHIRLPLGRWYKLAGLGREIWLDAGSNGAAAQAYWLHTYEPETLAPYLERVKRARCVLDVGTRDGFFALVAAAANPDARVLAFEPDPAAFELLCRHVNRNPDLRVEPIPIALGDRNGPSDFFLAGGNSSLNPSFRRNTTIIEVDTARGDDLLRRLGQCDVDLIKVDTESTEPEVLAGLQETVRNHRPDIICEVLAGRTERKLQGFLTEFGYHAFQLTRKGIIPVSTITGDPRHRELNYLFSHRGLLS